MGIPAIQSLDPNLSGSEIIHIFRNNGQPLYRGLHAQVELSDARSELLDSTDHVARFLSELCACIKMKPFGNPEVHRFGEGDLEGVTGNLFLYTSNICIHCWPLDLGASIDIFSCAEYDPHVAGEFCRWYFNAAACKLQVSLRAPIRRP